MSAGGGGRDLAWLRSRFAAFFFGSAFAVLAGAHLAGILGRAPAVAAGACLAVSLLAVAGRAALRWIDRWLWLIRWKLAASYVVIASVPVLLATGALLLVGYLATGQFFALLVSYRLQELRAAVDEVAAAIADDCASLVRGEPDGGRLRRTVVQDYSGGPALAALQLRFEKLSASAIAIRPASDEVIEFPKLEYPFAGRFERPKWVTAPGRAASFAVGRAGDERGMPKVEIRAAQLRRGPLWDVYVEVGLPIDYGPVRSEVRDALGVDFRLVRPAAAGGLPAPEEPADRERTQGWLGRLPLFGIYSLDLIDWRTGRQAAERRLLVVQRDLGGLVDELLGFRHEQEKRIFIYTALGLALVGFVVVEALSLAVGLRLARSITGSIHAIFEGTRRIERGELDHRIEVVSRDQLGSLSQSFNRMTESIQGLLASAAERERLEEELRIGRRIQQSLLPRAGYRHPRLEIEGMSLPAKEVGGDYYDYFDLDDGRIALLVADVSGKGTEAAFYMAEVKGIVMTLARRHARPRAVLCEANGLLGQSLDRRTFVTMTYGIIDARRLCFSFARAGHNPVLHLAPGAKQAVSLRPPGMALGVDRGAGFAGRLEEHDLELQPGGIVLLYTDGVTDTLSEAGELYGEERLRRALEAVRGRPAAAIRDALAAELRRFAAKGPPHDDLTMIVLRAL